MPAQPPVDSISKPYHQQSCTCLGAWCIPFNGVRISCVIVARNSDLALLASTTLGLNGSTGLAESRRSLTLTMMLVLLRNTNVSSATNVMPLRSILPITCSGVLCFSDSDKYCVIAAMSPVLLARRMLLLLLLLLTLYGSGESSTKR
jgi:hypothetical protein